MLIVGSLHCCKLIFKGKKKKIAPSAGKIDHRDSARAFLVFAFAAYPLAAPRRALSLNS
jgi:hypothetical protein